MALIWRSENNSVVSVLLPPLCGFWESNLGRQVKLKSCHKGLYIPPTPTISVVQISSFNLHNGPQDGWSFRSSEMNMVRYKECE